MLSSRQAMRLCLCVVLTLVLQFQASSDQSSRALPPGEVHHQQARDVRLNTTQSSGKLTRNKLRAEAGQPEPNVSTNNLSRSSVKHRLWVFGSFIGASSLMLLVTALCVFAKRRAETAAKEAELLSNNNNSNCNSKVEQGGGVGYEPLLEGGEGAEDAGLGEFSAEELAEALAEESKALSPEERQAQISKWALINAERVREKNETYLCRRKAILLFLLMIYVAASVGLPILHRSEATCDRGFFWETHMQFLALFVITKVVELWLYAEDPTVQWEMGVGMFMLKFLPSFLGYLDGYTDANAVVIAGSCPDAIAQQLALYMGICYLVGVIFLQWIVMLYFALQDPSQACLVKLLHMDLLASCITLPPDQKWTWDMLAVSRTVGEDIPQALLQTLYLLYVKQNPFMLGSVVMAVGSSLKALHDARARALEAAGAAAEFENRVRDTTLYSASQDGTIRCWDVRSGECTKTIKVGNPANSIAASNGMLYSSHDDGYIREWFVETGEMTRRFAHNGGNAIVRSTADKAYSWARDNDNPVYKEWSLITGECLQDIAAPVMRKAAMFVKGTRLYATATDATKNVAEWSLESGEFVRTFQGHTGPINALFATSKRLLSGSQDGTCREWSLETGQCTRVFDDHCSKYVSPICVVRDLLYNASNGLGTDINEWSLVTGKILRTFAGHTDSVMSITTLKDNLYSSSLDRTIKEWSLKTGECLQTLSGHTNYIQCIIVQFRDE
ncbi:unnamed protein product [Polarella glacialis]|uniref:Uncharacterized protein n=1 Tax=Polarella glacialis TaxID=89957 RepID=A0A813LKB4_POLGL|nr:unnamed protein product [Polarella glacialis]